MKKCMVIYYQYMLIILFIVSYIVCAKIRSNSKYIQTVRGVEYKFVIQKSKLF